jgi:hypothetical protein
MWKLVWTARSCCPDARSGSRYHHPCRRRGGRAGAFGGLRCHPRGPASSATPWPSPRLADRDVDPDQPTATGELACPAPRPRLLDAFIGHEAHQSAPLHPRGATLRLAPSLPRIGGAAACYPASSQVARHRASPGTLKRCRGPGLGWRFQQDPGVGGSPRASG